MEQAFGELMGRSIRFGSVYALIDRMAVAGWFKSREEWSGKRRTRFFRIEPEGMRALKSAHDRLMERTSFLGRAFGYLNPEATDGGVA